MKTTITLFVLILTSILTSGIASAEDRVPYDFGTIVLGDIEYDDGYTMGNRYYNPAFQPQQRTCNNITVLAAAKTKSTYVRIFFQGTVVHKGEAFAIIVVQYGGGSWASTREIYELAKGDIINQGICINAGNLIKYASNSITIKVDDVALGHATLICTLED